MDGKYVSKFEDTKDTPLGVPSQDAVARYKRMGYEPEDFFQHFPCFAGPKTLSRFLSLFECYRNTLGIAGHMAEVGVYRGACSLFLAKLTLLYEPHSVTQVHAFDWFKEPSQEEIAAKPQGLTYYEPYERVRDLVEVQGLQRYVLLHQLDVRQELAPFFAQYPHLQFKLVFLDAGEYEIVAECIRQFWPRLMPGGILILDQFNHELAPGETRATKECLPDDAVIRTFPHGWMPTAYVVKGERVRGAAAL